MNDIFLEVLIREINDMEEILHNIKGATKDDFILDYIDEIDRHLWKIFHYYKETKNND